MAITHYRVQLVDDAGQVVGDGFANIDSEAIKGKFSQKTNPREGFAGSGGKRYSGQGKGNGIYFTVGKAAVGRPDKPMPMAVWPHS